MRGSSRCLIGLEREMIVGGCRRRRGRDVVVEVVLGVRGVLECNNMMLEEWAMSRYAEGRMRKDRLLNARCNYRFDASFRYMLIQSASVVLCFFSISDLKLR